MRLRGPHNSTPLNNYLAGDGKSHVYRGPAYYVPSENRWIRFHEYRSLPRETKRDAILMESEEQGGAYQRKRDRETQPGGKTAPHPPPVTPPPHPNRGKLITLPSQHTQRRNNLFENSITPLPLIDETSSLIFNRNKITVLHVPISNSIAD